MHGQWVLNSALSRSKASSHCLSHAFKPMIVLHKVPLKATITSHESPIHRHDVIDFFDLICIHTI